jgi:DnaJ family protein C protein 13
MRFESEHRSIILTLALAQRGAFARSHQSDQLQAATAEFRSPLKFRWGQETGTKFRALVITCAGVEQISEEGERKSYHFKDIENVIELHGSQNNIFALEMRETKRLHIYSHSDRAKIIAKIRDNAAAFIGVQVGTRIVEEQSQNGNGNNQENEGADTGVGVLLDQRLGIYKEDEHITSLCEFAVQNAKRSRILLCLTETCLIERDPGTYCVRLNSG